MRSLGRHSNIDATERWRTPPNATDTSTEDQEGFRMLTHSADDVYAMARAMPEGAYLELSALKSTVPTSRT